jgi:hypothetical protein
MLFTHHKVRIEPCPGLREGDDFGVCSRNKKVEKLLQFFSYRKEKSTQNRQKDKGKN